MSLAMKRLKNIGWMALVFLVAILLYPLSLNVAAMHSDLMRVDAKILSTKREISFLQAELRTRASLQQLEEWNEVLYGYAPPTSDQFLDGETELAGLGGSNPVTKPVMVSVNQADGTAPAGIIGSPFAKMADATKTDEPKQTVQKVAQSDSKSASENSGASSKPDKPTSDKPVKDALQSQNKSPRPTESQTSRTVRLAKIDEKLLSEDFLSDIAKKSQKERKRK
jgi:hypothetical protein